MLEVLLTIILGVVFILLFNRKKAWEEKVLRTHREVIAWLTTHGRADNAATKELACLYTALLDIKSGTIPYDHPIALRLRHLHERHIKTSVTGVSVEVQNLSDTLHYVSNETYHARGDSDAFIIELVDTLKAMVRHGERQGTGYAIWK